MKQVETKRISILTIGSTGDVLPFISLALRLKTFGHAVRIVTGVNFEELIRSYGLDFYPIDFDLYKVIQNPHNKSFYTSNIFKFLKTSYDLVLPEIMNIYDQSWEGAKDCEVLIFHPIVSNGPHIAEKLGVPSFMASTVPGFTVTSEFPSAAMPVNFNKLTNQITFHLVRSSSMMFYSAITKWRRKTLGMKGYPIWRDHLIINGQNIPIMYCHSPNVLSRPSNWPDYVEVTGYWFCEREDNWYPSDRLIKFLDHPDPPFYVGFGSMVGTDPEKVSNIIVDAFKYTKERCILATGWGGIKSIEMPENIHVINYAPHEWLFPRVKAVIHHGGAGTTAAGLRAGKPTIICPFLLDQFFWGNLIYKKSLGPEPIPIKNITKDKLLKAIVDTACSHQMADNASEIGRKICTEDGPLNAINFMNRFM